MFKVQQDHGVFSENGLRRLHAYYGKLAAVDLAEGGMHSRTVDLRYWARESSVRYN